MSYAILLIMYYFIRWKHTEEGYVPDIPEGIGFLMLADSGRACDGAAFALFRCCLPDGYEGSGSVNQVSNDLVELLHSAEDYPPALALARKDIESDESRSETEFSKKLVERLTFYLQEQTHSPFFMAQARKTKIGYKHAGGYYWIVGDRDRSVLWVSRDYHVYSDPLGDFGLDPDEMERRFPCVV
jgi:hypothetical protein